ncbi:conserved hypothetical protein [Trichinella spiralis]|uniref:hypothetical protein n=1 Tax=Trichinella spiralis TaxID=6334 RepID=UPI0001EFDA98|nr:conserved hypothetical protein [Trichinella spiralis]
MVARPTMADARQRKLANGASGENRRQRAPLMKELSDAETIWLREIQVTEFGTKPNSSERVRVFEPFLDQDGLLRMGGRLRRSTLPPESKHPIILPHNHRVTELLIKDHHVRQMHAGVNQNIVSHQNKILDHQSQQRSKEDNPFMPGMS